MRSEAAVFSFSYLSNHSFKEGSLLSTFFVPSGGTVRGESHQPRQQDSCPGEEFQRYLLLLSGL